MRILIAEDYPDLRELLADLLTSNGHEVVTAANGELALREYLKNGEFDYVVTDYQMPRKNGVVLIMDIRRINKAQKVILVSADPPQLSPATREDAGEFPVLHKPYRNEDMLALLK